MFSSTLEIKKIINPHTLPPQCDFALPTNTLVYAIGSDFKNDFDQLQQEFGFPTIQLNLLSRTEDGGHFKHFFPETHYISK